MRAHIGYVFGGDRGLYERLSALDNLRYFAELYGVDPARQRQRIAEPRAGWPHRPGEGARRGLFARHAAALHIARGLLHDPPVVFLDEPTIGVDPVGARELRSMIASLVQSGKTVLLTTHYMFEADQLCDRIAVIAKGKIVAEGTPRPEEHGHGRQRRRGRGLRDRRADGRRPATARRCTKRVGRGSRAGPGDRGSDGRRGGADARDPQPARRRQRGPRLHARADARGRVRRTRSED